ncbi:MFS transporter [Sporosarcina limicola]|uniref:MFS family arabinose efflux permease n=1 Tax=Sporosarcina limicola TaxID=34101 RepID=A0A927MHW9_9BACL|nr:MFS transporter [Sporosarcina limicola]MBE1554725.1 putative MFS family arabinose efflux permease [Sporosarcina limicola]
MGKTKTQVKKWITLCILILGGGTIFKLSSLKDAFYIPMQEHFHLTHTQIGLALSTYAMVQTIGYVFSIYIADRFSKRILIPVGLIGTGLIGIYLSTFPSYYGILAAWGGMALFAEVIFWPVLIKAVKLLGNANEQGRMFGFLEAGRGVVDTIVAFSALGIFIYLGSGAVGFKAAILFLAIITIVVGIVCYFFIEDDKTTEIAGDKRTANKNKQAFNGALRALKIPELWVASFVIFSVYSVYAGLTYFIPFLKEIYGMPVALVGAYGIVNQYGLKMVGGPVGGFLVDKKFKSATKYLRFSFLLSAVAMVVFILLPHETMNIYVGMVATLGFGAIIFTQRAVFFAPLGEIDIPDDISGAAVSIACLVGYAPSIFAFTMYGSLLDANPGITGYRYVFMIMIAFALIGFVISSYLARLIKKKRKSLA